MQRAKLTDHHPFINRWKIRKFVQNLYPQIMRELGGACTIIVTSYEKWAVCISAFGVITCRIMAPVTHGGPQGQDLIFKFRTCLAGQHVKLQGKLVVQLENPVFPGYHKRGSLFAGTS